MKKILLVPIIILVFSINCRSQLTDVILDVPYRSDMSCGVWCWATCSHMIIVYYGNDVYLCDLLELMRQQYPGSFNTSDCCVDPDSCCTGGSLCGSTSRWASQGLLNAYGISSWCDSDSVISETQAQSFLSQNRPIITRRYGHVRVIYGYEYGNLYMHNPGNGSEIESYDYYVNYSSKPWLGTLVPNVGASSCPLTQHVIGRIKLTESVYKATNTLYLGVTIESTADTEFYSGGDVVINSGFHIGLGATVYIEAGASLVCP